MQAYLLSGVRLAPVIIHAIGRQLVPEGSLPYVLPKLYEKALVPITGLLSRPFALIDRNMPDRIAFFKTPYCSNRPLLVV